MVDIYDIDEATKNTLRACLPEVLERYKQIPIRHIKRRYKICCPFHKERTPSCEVNPKKGVYHCYGCGASGDVFSLVANEENLDLSNWQDFQRAAKIIADIGKVRLKLKAMDCDDNAEPSIAADKDTLKNRPTAAPELTSAPIYSAPAIPRRYIKPEELSATTANYQETGLYDWMCHEFDRADVNRVFNEYQIGGAEFRSSDGHRASCFPYISVDGRCVDCKIFHIDPSTGSRKTAAPIGTYMQDGLLKKRTSTWLLFELLQSAKRAGKVKWSAEARDFRAAWCNFGDHLLLERPTADVCLVESEKTALIAALTYPEKIWIAVGSKSNLYPKNTPERFFPYRGRRVVIFPDRDGYDDDVLTDKKGKTYIIEGWRSIAKRLSSDGYNISLDTTTSRHDGTAHDDIADIILRYRHGSQQPPKCPNALIKSPDKLEAEAIFEEMKKNCPALAELAEKFELEPISVEPYRCQNKNE